MARVVDCRGMSCPQPVIEAKRALEEAGGETVVVIVDNEAARQNVARFAESKGLEAGVEDREGAFWITIQPKGGQTAGGGGQERAAAKSAGFGGGDGTAPGIAYLITASAIGQGSPDLGEVLMKSFMTAISQQKPPRSIALMNTGVYLAVEGSSVLEQVRALAAAGTEVLVCGTCLTYYRLTEKLAAGRVSNMLEITECLAACQKVITIA